MRSRARAKSILADERPDSYREDDFEGVEAMACATTQNAGLYTFRFLKYFFRASP
jgi:hypothetical protein